MYTLWREDDKALKDFQDVVNTQGLSPEVCAHTGEGRGVWWLYDIIHRDFPLRFVHVRGRGVAVCHHSRGLPPKVCACAGKGGGCMSSFTSP